MSQLFASGSQSIGASASAPVLPVSIQDWFPLGLSGLILLEVQGTLKSLLQHHNSKASILKHSAFFMVEFSCVYMTTGKTIVLTIWTFVSKVISLLCNMLSRFVIAFLPKSKCHHLQWFWSPRKYNMLLLPFFPIYVPWSDGLDAMIFIFWMLSFKPTFSLSSSISSRGFLVLLHFLP